MPDSVRYFATVRNYDCMTVEVLVKLTLMVYILNIYSLNLYCIDARQCKLLELLILLQP